MSEQKALPEVKEEILTLSSALSKEIKIAADGTATIEPGVYVKHLPESITEEQVKALQAHNAQFTAAAAHAFGEHAIKDFKKHKAHETLELEVPFVGKDHLNLSIVRERTSPNPAKPGTTITTHGAMSVSMTTQAGRGSVGELAKVRKLVAAQAAAALAE